MMSIRRLWVRFSKCSRESLYLCGERITAITFFSVGRGTGPTTVAPARVTVSTIFLAEMSRPAWSYDYSRMRIFCPAMIISFSFSHKTLVLRFKGNPALSYLFAHTTIFLSTHFDVPGALSTPQGCPRGGDISMTLRSAACGLGEFAKANLCTTWQ